MAKTKIRLVPHDIEAERGVLGAILGDANAYHQVSGIISAESFFSPAHRMIYEAIAVLMKGGKPVDEITITAVLRSRELLDGVGGALYIAELAEAVPYSANVAVYAEVVVEMHHRAHLIGSLMDIRNALDDGGTAAKAVDALQGEVQAYHKAQSVGAFETTGEVLVQALAALSNNRRKVPTGFKVIDSETGGLGGGELHVLAARTSVGKSAFALKMVLNVGKYVEKQSPQWVKPILYFSLEMSNTENGLRALMIETGMTIEMLRSFDDIQFKAVEQAVDTLGIQPVLFQSSKTWDVGRLVGSVRAAHAKYHGLSLVVIDYLQLVEADVGKRGASEVEKLTIITRSLKTLASALDIPVLVLAQLNRVAADRSGLPKLHDLRGSGSIEQDADVVCFLYELSKGKGTGVEGERLLGLAVAKNRGGPVGSGVVCFTPATTNFMDYETSRF